MPTTTRMSLAEFLALPETKPYREFVAGEVVEKVAPNFYHGRLAVGLIGLLLGYAGEHPDFLVLTEVRHLSASEERVYIPDVSVIRADRLRRDAAGRVPNPVDVAPDLAIEILSPGDRPGALLNKVAFYLREGIALVWVVDPEARELNSFSAEAGPQTHRPPGVVDAEPVLPGFQLDLSRLFSVLDEPSR